MNLLKEQCKRCGGLFDALPGSVYCNSCGKGRIHSASPLFMQRLLAVTKTQEDLIKHAEMFGGEVLGVTVHIKFPINSCTISPDGKTNWIKE